MPINWNPFYDTSYDINQITYIHNIDVTLQLVSAQKDAYYARVSFKLRALARESESERESERSERERERERERELLWWCSFKSGAKTQARTGFYKVLIIMFMAHLCYIFIYIVKWFLKSPASFRSLSKYKNYFKLKYADCWTNMMKNITAVLL